MFNFVVGAFVVIVVVVVALAIYMSPLGASPSGLGAPKTVSLTFSTDIGTTAGGTTVVIGGTDMSDVTDVTFDGDAAGIVSTTAAAVTVTTPAHAAGVVVVEVTTSTGAVYTRNFTYEVPA